MTWYETLEQKNWVSFGDTLINLNHVISIQKVCEDGKTHLLLHYSDGRGTNVNVTTDEDSEKLENFYADLKKELCID